MDSADEFQSTPLDPRTIRKTYLVTYSQANRIIFPTRESFGQKVSDAFDRGVGKVKVMHWACCLESHENGGDHYHVSLKLSGSKRWKGVKDFLAKDSGIQVNFSDKHDDYWTAFKYITKSDQNIYLSRGHPNMQDMCSPRTKNCVQALRKKRNTASSNTADDQASTSCVQKMRRLSNFEVSEFITRNNLKSEDELFAIAHSQKEEGKKDLANFLLSRSIKSLGDLFESTRRMSNATSTIVRSQMTRMDLIEEAAKKDCICNGEWLECANEVLADNGTHPFVFADRLRSLLIHGRGKHRNMIIVGPANCGKTFLLKPILKIFKTFANPANDKYAWVGAEKAEAIFLNDFRWSSELIKWNDCYYC